MWSLVGSGRSRRQYERTLQFWTIKRGSPHIAFWKAEFIVNVQSIPLFKSSNEKLYYVLSVQPPLINMAIQKLDPIFFKSHGGNFWEKLPKKLVKYYW